MTDEGLWLPPGARTAAKGMSFESQAHRALSLGRTGGPVEDPTANEMRQNRQANLRKGGMVGVGGGNLSMATMKPNDPMWYWQQNNLPYRIDNEDDLKRLRTYCALLYLTHPVIASAVDIYSKFPLADMEFVCKDPEVADFYNDLFLDQLDYEEFLVKLLREYWVRGEAWPFGSFNEILGVWEDDELLNPDDIRVTQTPFAREPRFEMKLPATLRNILDKRAPLWEYEKLIRAYPSLLYYQAENSYMPVSPVLLRQLAFKADTFHPRGIPILLRGLRAVMQEEMLNAAQDAVASRLYTPLVLVRLGASATDLGGNAEAWIPTPDDIANFEASLDAALAADFRMLTHHFAVQMDTVFGREVMPDFAGDFDRLTERQLQVFGLTKTAISGASSGQTYAADALNIDLASQLLQSAQKLVKRFVHQRMLVVAEAQGHFDGEVRGGHRYVITEEVLEIDEETGEQRIVEQPKLLVPEIRLKSMDLRREQERRDFIEQAVAGGVPISQETRFVNIPVDLDEERDKVKDEQVANAVAEQEAVKATYLALKARGLFISPELEEKYGAKTSEDPSQPSSASSPAASGPAAPALAATIDPLDPNKAHPDLVPTPAAIKADQTQDGQVGGAGASNVIPLTPRNRANDPARTRPPESDSQRRHMPVAMAKRGYGTVEPRVFHTVVDETGQSHVATDANGMPIAVTDEDGNPIIDPLIHGPSHVGMRRYAKLLVDPHTGELIDPSYEPPQPIRLDPPALGPFVDDVDSDEAM
jgi:hypothetical protein